jgi:Domain of unknown function (DUF4265)
LTDPRRIGFPLERDEDGYPPAENEWLWASDAAGLWSVDNIPWYSRDVSFGDLVEVDEDVEAQLWFRRTAEPSGHSTFRVLVREQDPGPVAALRTRLEALGCSSEQWSEELPLLAVDVPAEVDIEPVIAMLDEGEAQERWGWESGLVSEVHSSKWPK